jgi:hypothetical protein
VLSASQLQSHQRLWRNEFFSIQPVLTEPARHGFHPAMALTALVLVCLASCYLGTFFWSEGIHAQDEAPLVSLRALRFEDRRRWFDCCD